MSTPQAEPAGARGKGNRRKVWSTVIFAVAMAAIFLGAVFLGRMDRPPDMPLTEEHNVTDKKPNPVCMACHAPDSLPKKHPLDYEKFACTRCHVQPGKAPRK